MTELAESAGLPDQRDLIENTDWSDILILDASRFDAFERVYRNYFNGELTKCWNGGIGWTYDWFERNFRERCDAVLFSSAPVVPKTGTGGRKWGYPGNFCGIVGHREIEADLGDFDSPETMNHAVLHHPWKGRRVVRYLCPHKPWPRLPWSAGIGTQGEIKRRIKSGQVTKAEIWRAYMEKLRIGFKGAVELYPYLGGKVVVTSDHGELFGEAGEWLHAHGHPKIPALVHVPWLEVESLK